MQLATPANMRKYEDERNVFAYSPVTGERYSANHNDYILDVADDIPLVDEDGAPMVLAVEHVEIRVL